MKPKRNAKQTPKLLRELAKLPNDQRDEIRRLY